MTGTSDGGATVLLVGTRKGLWIGRSDDARVDWSWTGPHFDMEEVYSCMVDTRGDTAAAAGRRLVQLDRPAGVALGRPRRDLAGDAQRRRPLPRRASTPRSSGSGSWSRAPRPASSSPAPSRARSSAPPTAARRSPSSGPCGTTRTGPSGAPASAARPSTPCCRTPPTRGRSPPPSRAAASTRPPTAARPGRRATRASAPSSCPRGSSTPSSASACTRWPGTRPLPSGCSPRTTAASTAPTTRAATWQYIADGLPADFGFPMVVHPHQPDTIFTFPIQGGDARYPARRQGAGVALARRGRDLGGARRRPAGRRSSSE